MQSVDCLDTDVPTRTSAHWSQHRGVSLLLRVLVALLPVALSIILTFGASRLLPTPSGISAVVVQWVLLSLLSTGVLVGLRHVARRLLPLTTMAGLALVFPDRVPSRMGMALRTGSVTDLDARVHRARMLGATGTESEAAGGLLELVCDLGTHDRSTRGHAERVRALSQLIAREMGLPENDRDLLNWSALLHDIGKLDVPRDVLGKAEPLAGADRDLIESHVAAGERLVRPLEAWLGPWLAAVAEHHERWDGQGYPRGLTGEDIALSARIVAVADAFDVMTDPGARGARLTPDEARAELTRGAGTQFDPEVVRAFLAIGMSRLRVAMGPLSWLANLPVVGRIPITPAIAGVFGAAVAATALFSGGAGTGAGANSHAAPPVAVVEAPTGPVTQEPDSPPPVPPSPGNPPPHDPRLEDPPPGNPPSDEPRPEDPPPGNPPPIPGPTPPSAPSFNITINEDGSVDIDLGDPIGLWLVDGVDHGVLVGTGPASVRYDPYADFNGADGFSYKRCSPVLCAGASVHITVRPVNDDPVAVTDVSFGLEDGGPFDVDVLANDTDVDSGSLAVVGVSGAVGGTAVVLPNGRVRFTPGADVNGSTLFSYAISDGEGGRDRGSAVISLVPVNDPPSFLAGADHGTFEDSGAQSVAAWATSISTGPADESGQSVTYTAAADRPSLFSVQPAVAPNGTLTYTPAPDANGTATITVAAQDNGGTANGGADTSADQTAEIMITAVNDEPVAGDDPDGGDDPAAFRTVLVTELFIDAAELLDNDTDIDLDTLAVAASGPTTTGLGSVQCDTPGCTYTPNGTVGTDTFDYTVTDGNGGTDMGTVTVDVVDYLASPDQRAVVVNEVLYNGLSHSGETGDFIELHNPTGAAMDISGWVLSDNNLIQGATDPGGGFSYVVPEGTLIPAGDYAVLWLGTDLSGPVPGFNNVPGGGVVELYLGRADNLLAASGDDVTLYDDRYGIVDHVAWGPTTAPDRKTPIPVTVGVWDAPTNNEVNLQPTTLGTSIALTPDGTFTSDSNCWEETGSGSATCAGAERTVDTDSFPWRVSSVGSTNTAAVPPAASADAYSTDEDTILSVPAPGLLGNDSDDNDDLVTVNTTPVTGPADGALTLSDDGSFDYDPDPGFSGTDTFVYEIDDSDGGTDAATVTITVSSAIVPGGLYLGSSGPSSEWFDLVAALPLPAVPVPDYDGDSDSDPGLTIEKSRGNENEADPQKYQEWSYAPTSALELTGPISLDLWSTVADYEDDEAIHVKTFVHDCADDNTDCRRLVRADYHIDDWNRGIGNFMFRDVALGNLDTTILPGRMLRVNVMFDHEDVWIAMTQAHPSFIDWTEGPRPPVANDDGPIVLDEDTGPVNIDVLANDGDASLDPTSVRVVSGPSIGTAAVQPGGSVDYTPDAGRNGGDSFAYEVCDTTAACSTATVTISVTAAP